MNKSPSYKDKYIKVFLLYILNIQYLKDIKVLAYVTILK